MRVKVDRAIIAKYIEAMRRDNWHFKPIILGSAHNLLSHNSHVVEGSFDETSQSTISRSENLRGDRQARQEDN
jgi:hypothetical protein